MNLTTLLLAKEIIEGAMAILIVVIPASLAVRHWLARRPSR